MFAVSKSIFVSSSSPILISAANIEVIVVCSASTANVLLAAIVPPPLSPSPAVNVTLVWSMCSLATKSEKPS